MMYRVLILFVIITVPLCSYGQTIFENETTIAGGPTEDRPSPPIEGEDYGITIKARPNSGTGVVRIEINNPRLVSFPFAISVRRHYKYGKLVYNKSGYFTAVEGDGPKISTNIDLSKFGRGKRYYITVSAKGKSKTFLVTVN